MQVDEQAGKCSAADEIARRENLRIYEESWSEWLDMNAGMNQLTRGRYTWKQKVVSEVMLFAFRGVSTQRRWGDQFVGLFVRSGGESRQWPKTMTTSTAALRLP